MSTLKELVSKARNGVKLHGYWEKENKEGSSYVAKITGVKIGAEDREDVDLAFVNGDIEKWLSEKEAQHPAAMMVWTLGEGLYKARIVENAGVTPKTQYFAVIDGAREELSRSEAFVVAAGLER